MQRGKWTVGQAEYPGKAQYPSQPPPARGQKKRQIQQRQKLYKGHAQSHKNAGQEISLLEEAKHGSGKQCGDKDVVLAVDGDKLNADRARNIEQRRNPCLLFPETQTHEPQPER